MNLRLNGLRKLIIFFLFLGFSLFTYLTIPAYVPFGDQLLQNHNFSANFKGWVLSPDLVEGQVAVTNGSLKVHHRTTEKNTYISQTLPAHDLNNHLILSAEISTQDIIQDENSRDIGRVVLIQYDKDQKAQYAINHILMFLEKNNESQQKSKTFHIASTTKFIKIAISLNSCTGTVYCNSISLYNASSNPWFLLIKVINLLLWGTFTAILFFPYLSNTRTGPCIFIICIAITIIAGVSITGSKKVEYRSKLIFIAKNLQTNITQEPQSEIIAEPKQTSPSYNDNPESKGKVPDITKIAHFLLFMLLAFGLSLQKPQNSTSVLLDVSLLAAISETIQLFHENRTPLVGDVIIDITGALLGIIMHKLYRRVFHRK